MPKLSRTKGKAWEQAVARMLREAMPSAAEQIRRGWQSRKGDDDPDVIAPQLSVECKHRKAPVVRAALEQAVRTANTGTWPIAVCRWHGQAAGDAVAAMRLEDLLELLGEWWALREA
jgi:hypothetical protein